MEEDDVVEPVVEVGVAGGSDGSSFFSTLIGFASEITENSGVI